MGRFKILTGDHHACQEAVQWRKLRAKCDSAAIRAGTSPPWDLLPRLLSRKGRAGPEQGHGDGEDLKLGWGGGQGQDRSGRLRDTCHPAQARSRARAAALNQVTVKTGRTSPFPASCTQLCCMAAWLHQAAPQPTSSPTRGWVGEGRLAHRKALKC